MKRLLIFLLMIGALLSLTSVAKAEYAISISYGYGNYVDRGHRDFNRRDHRRWIWQDHYYNRGRFIYGSYYPYGTTVVKTYQVAAPIEVIVAGKDKLGIADIIVLHKAGINDDTIIDRIAKSQSRFNLTVEEVEALTREGVSARVVNFMLDTAKKN